MVPRASAPTAKKATKTAPAKRAPAAPKGKPAARAPLPSAAKKDSKVTTQASTTARAKTKPTPKTPTSKAAPQKKTSSPPPAPQKKTSSPPPAKLADKVEKPAAPPPAPVAAPAPVTQPADRSTFRVGDKAVYPAQGVAEVIKIEEKDIGGTRMSFYVLRIMDTERKIMVPVNNATAVGLRQVISEQEIREIFDILRERTMTFDNQTWNRRYRGFMDKIKTGSIYDVAEVLRDLYRLRTDKQLSFGERRMLETARGLIVKEIAISRSQTEDQVRAEIEAIFLTN